MRISVHFNCFFQRNNICGRLLWVNFRLSICDRPFLTVYFKLFIFRCNQLKTIKARTNIWFLIIIPPLGILFFLVERYFIAANRQVSTHFCAHFAHFCYTNVLFCSKTIIFVLEPCILRSHDCSRCKNATLQADANLKKKTKKLKNSFCLLSETKLAIGSATYIRLAFIRSIYLVA